ncbi:hypothetical protein [Borrelia hermsii]|uniref:Uncharacterized protein n=1 Tax=Borrelia hermsii TaxID=140 RepID=A0AAN1CFL4_BORHE|nr:hypothetical protein [Borrelia hermsii]AMR76227.1 hypothetical protein A0V01_06480 [Borrelia hermsii]UPA08207.1 hypothetical protein bhDAH_000910 [Borrelia hermsii DAH]UPA08260.1 hypothetical protein bhDAH_000917 [Borrelia hermsii DAH]UPA08309.1 hypothetical protein bhDAH_001030 [Borrelia hermsii DAH]UPA08348.1 hypothetical protein bhDAH_000991 [Borrelia hermsii DAH]
MVVLLLMTYQVVKFLCKFSKRTLEKIIYDYYSRQEFLEDMRRLDHDLRLMEIMSRLRDKESSHV